MKFSNSKQNISRNKYILPWTGWKYLVENSISEFALEIQYQWKLCKHERNVFPWEKKKKKKKKKKRKDHRNWSLNFREHLHSRIKRTRYVCTTRENM